MKISNMYMIMMKFIIIILILSICSCKKMIEIDPPINESTEGTIFKTEAAANSALNGLYVSFLQSFDNSFLLIPSFSSDELKDNTNQYIEFYNNLIRVDNAYNSNIWSSFYNLIYQSNSIIEGVSSSNSLGTSVKNKLLGEAKFMRAFINFELVNFYGDIPLLTTTDVKVTALTLRSSKDKVYQQMILDLKDAQDLLSDAYLTADRARVNKTSATALLARVYLYNKDYLNSEIQASKCIETTNLYQLESLSNVFLKSSNETIFQIANPYGYTLGNFLVPEYNATKVNYPFTDDFIKSIEANDQRKSNWMNIKSINNVVYTYPNKYKKTSLTTGLASEYLIVLRLGEQYLIRAEARVMQQKIDAAKEDLNIIRNRSGLESNTQIDKKGLLLSIEKERRVELCAEFGHRWFDLKRTDRIDAIMKHIKPNWKPASALYPIPLDELNRNPNLTPNPGY